MKEKGPVFSKEEEQQIASGALALAGLGEEAIEAAELIKLQLLTTAAVSIGDSIPVESGGKVIRLTKKEARRKADILEQVVFRARAVLQIEHIDSVSLRDNFYIKEGWGSVFDPESKIRKLLDSKGITVY